MQRNLLYRRLTRREAITSALAVGVLGPLGPHRSALAARAAADGVTEAGYVITELPGLDGSGSRALAVNNDGVVVGEASLAPTSKRPIRLRAVRWINGQPTPLETLGGEWDHAYGINNLGVSVGSSMTGNGFFHACMWDADGRITDLTPHSDEAVANAINDRGDIVGYVGGGWSFNGGPALWSNGAMTKLPKVGVVGGIAYAINEAGIIVGYENFDLVHNRAVRWSGGVAEYLGGLENATARDVNDRGEVVGWSGPGSDSPPFKGESSFGFVWAEGSVVTMLSPPSAVSAKSRRSTTSEGSSAPPPRRPQ